MFPAPCRLKFGIGEVRLQGLFNLTHRGRVRSGKGGKAVFPMSFVTVDLISSNSLSSFS